MAVTYNKIAFEKIQKGLINLIAFAFPPGYRRFLRLGLAKEISSAFDAGLTPELQMSANEAKAEVKRANMRLSDRSSGLPGVIFGGVGPHYNIYSDT